MTDEAALRADALHAFGVFAEHRNFTTAASVLHLSQPSLHVKIRKLQAGLGVELYRREGRGLRLTDAGRRLATFARDADRRAQDLMAGLRASAAPVTLAAGRGALRWVIGDGLRRLAEGGRDLRLRTADRAAALAALHEGDVDLAVVGLDPPPAGLRGRRLAVYPQVLVVPDDHPLAAQRLVRLADLGGLRLVVPPAERPHRRALDRATAAADIAWSVAAEVDGWDLQVHLAALGFGATVVNGCVVPPDGLTAVPVTDLPHVGYWAAWRPERDDLVVDAVAALVPT